MDNSAEDYGGGFYCNYYSNPILENVMITGNMAFYGAGIYCKDNSSPGIENVTIMDNSAECYGGGIYCEDHSSPGLEYVTILANLAGEYGGGIFCYYYSNLNLENVTIRDNSADSGGGVCCETSSPSLENVTITGNSSNMSGGGIFCWNSHPSLENVTITENSTGYYGGGISCEYSYNMNLKNVTIADNSSESYGGGILCSSSNLSFKNVTITNNSAEDYGGGIYCSYSSSSSLVNCIFWNNSPQAVEFASDNDLNIITIAYSNIDGGDEGIETNNNGTVNWLEGNIDANPLFVDAELGDYHLAEDSPCIDTGIAYFEYEGEVLVDLSEDEYYGTAPDMGAYESPFTVILNDEIESVEDCVTIYPNPFNPETNISFELLEAGNVLLEFYNIKGQKVTTLVNESFKAGSHKVTWNAENYASGIYLLRFNAAEINETKKLILLK